MRAVPRAGNPSCGRLRKSGKVDRDAADVVAAGKPNIGKIGSFKVEPPAVCQWKVRVKSEAHPLPGVVLDNHGHAVRNPTRANIGIARRLVAAKTLQALVQIVVTDKSVDTKIRAAQQRAAEIDADIAQRLILKRAIRAGIGRGQRRKVFILKTPLGQQTAAGIPFPKQPAAGVVDARENFKRVRL